MVGALGLMLGVLALLGAVDGVVAGGLGGEWVWHAWNLLPVVALFAGALGIALVAWATRHLPSWVIAGGLVVIGVFYVAASWDEERFLHPLSLEEFSPLVPRGSESWELSVRDWLSEEQHVASEAGSAVYIRAPASNVDKYLPELSEKRDKIERAWADLASVREWFAALNAFPEIGDRMPARFDGPLIRFAPVRAMTQVSCARANLLAFDGNGDEAADTLLPVIEVARKLEPGARTLLRAMIARVMLGAAIESLRFVLANSEVSPARRAALAAALERGVSGPAGVRRLMVMEYVLVFDGYYRHGVPAGIKAPHAGDSAIDWLRRPFFLPHATANLHGAHVEELARFAEKRDLARLTACERQFAESLRTGELNNPLGRLMLALSVPATSKVAESYWAKEDLRLAMIVELRKPK